MAKIVFHKVAAVIVPGRRRRLGRHRRVFFGWQCAGRGSAPTYGAGRRTGLAPARTVAVVTPPRVMHERAIQISGFHRGRGSASSWQPRRHGRDREPAGQGGRARRARRAGDAAQRGRQGSRRPRCPKASCRSARPKPMRPSGWSAAATRPRPTETRRALADRQVAARSRQGRARAIFDLAHPTTA